MPVSDVLRWKIIDDVQRFDVSCILANTKSLDSDKVIRSSARRSTDTGIAVATTSAHSGELFARIDD